MEVVRPQQIRRAPKARSYARGVRGHAPPENFGKKEAKSCILVHFKSQKRQTHPHKLRTFMHKMLLFDASTKPVLLYNSEIWADFQERLWNNNEIFERVHRKVCKHGGFCRILS